MEFPAPLSGPERLQRSLTFGFRVLPVIASYLRLYTGLNLRERIVGECLAEEECEVLWDEEH